MRRPIITFLEFCLKNNYFLFKNRYFEQVSSVPPAHQIPWPTYPENPKEDDSIPFLDTLGPNNTLTTLAYRKPTHTDQYIHWDINDNLPAKYSVYSTLAHSAKMVCTNQQALKHKEDHNRQALLRCNYPPWVPNRLHTKINHSFNTNQAQNTDNTTTLAKLKTFSSSVLH